MLGSMILDQEFHIGEREWESEGKSGLSLGTCNDIRLFKRPKRCSVKTDDICQRRFFLIFTILLKIPRFH